jgi:hypothetical protein
MPGVAGGLRQGAMSGLAGLQQALGARGIQLQASGEDDDISEGSEESQDGRGHGADGGVSRQDVSQFPWVEVQKQKLMNTRFSGPCAIRPRINLCKRTTSDFIS